MKMADFHQDTLNPLLYKILNSPEFEYARERNKQIPQAGLQKMDIVFSSLYRRLNEEMKSGAVAGSAEQQQPIRADIEKILDYYKSTDDFKIIEKPEDLVIVPEDTKSNSVILHLEGGDIITDPQVIDELYGRGVRSVGLLYSHDNQLGGGASGDVARGLTALGRQVVQKMLERNMIIDLAHANHKTAQDILEATVDYGKTVVTHTGFGTKQRFVTPELLKEIAQSGGVIGFTPATPFFPTLANYIENMKKASDLTGATDNLAVGTDFGGLSAEHLYAELDEIGKFSVIADKLSEQGGFGDDDIAKIMYGNIERIVKKL
jgi:microsomal dipeptidase-like Zn-dependent dipeptidase